MRQVVRDAFLIFTEPLEGGVPYLYNDVRGLTTVAYGNLVNRVVDVLFLPWKRLDGTPALPDEIAAAWQCVHNDPAAAARGHLYAKGLTKIRLTREGMGALALGKVDANDVELIKQLPDFETFPACAQLAMHSWAWAVGAHGHFPRLFSALKARDFDAASVEIHMNEYTPEGIRNAGLVPRNVANKALMRNAARVEAFKLDPDLLEWKHDLDVSDLDTQPDPAALPFVNTDIMESLPETTTADQPTVIVHPDPSIYLRNKPEDP